MTELKPLVCEKCGGSVNRKTMRCRYCDTEYAYDNNGMQMRFVVEKPGTNVIKATVKVDRGMVLNAPERATAYALDKMRHQVADGLLAFMKISTEFDPREMCEVIRGEVRVIDPMFTNY